MNFYSLIPKMEMFTTYMGLVAEAREGIRAHVDHLVGQLARIIAAGVTQGEFTVADPTAAGRAVFDATSRFHNPAHAPEWSDPGIDAPSRASGRSSWLG